MSDRIERTINSISFRKPGEPVEVYVLQKIFAFQEVNSSTQTFTVRKGEEVAVTVTQEEFERFEKLKAEGRCDEFKPDFWMDFYAYNGTNVEWEDPLLCTNGSQFFLRNHEGKCVCWRQRMNLSTFVEPFELQHFPYDVQPLTMTFMSHIYGNSDATYIFKPWAGGCGYSAKFVNPQGEFTVLREKTNFRVKGAQIICTLMIRRNWQFFFYRVMMILGLVSLMGPIVFLIEGGIADQAGYLSTTVLTAVAYLYIVASYTPILKYLTFLDKFVFGCVLYTMTLFCQIVAIDLYKEPVEEVHFFIANVSIFLAGIVVFAGLSIRAFSFESGKLDMDLPPSSPGTLKTINLVSAMGLDGRLNK